MAAYETTLPVRFGQVDYAGIMFYPRFFENFHAVFVDMFGKYTRTVCRKTLHSSGGDVAVVRIHQDDSNAVALDDTSDVANPFGRTDDQEYERDQVGDRHHDLRDHQEAGNGHALAGVLRLRNRECCRVVRVGLERWVDVDDAAHPGPGTGAPAI